MGSLGRVLTCSVSVAGARWPVSCAMRRVEWEAWASGVFFPAAGITGFGAMMR